MGLCGNVIAVREVQNSLYPSVIVEFLSCLLNKYKDLQ